MDRAGAKWGAEGEGRRLNGAPRARCGARGEDRRSVGSIYGAHKRSSDVPARGRSVHKLGVGVGPEDHLVADCTALTLCV